MTLVKDESILDLLERLRLEDRGWEILDYWDSDLCAIGIIKKGSPHRLVYVCTFGLPPGHYYYDSEVQTGPELADVTVDASNERASFDELLVAMTRHLGEPERGMPK